MHLDGNESHGETANLAYGCRSCNGKLAAAFKAIGAGRPTNQYNPARNKIPTLNQYAWAVSQGGPRGHHLDTGGAHDEAGAIIHATPKRKRIEYARQIAAGKTSRARQRDDERWNPAGGRPKWNERWFKTQGAAGDFAAGIYRDAWGVETRKVNKSNKRYAGGYTVRWRWKDARRNPAESAAAAFEEFHGHAPDVVTRIRKSVHSHRVLAGAGVLKFLEVAGIDGKVHTISKFGRALLAFNEAMNQLFVEGGDQSVNLDDYGIVRPHELENLGEITDIGYHTKKSYPGPDFGDAIYVHRFRTTNENGEHVVVAIKRYPTLIYRVLDEQFEFAGGSYEIRREGIDF